MSEILSSEQVAALVEPAKPGDGRGDTGQNRRRSPRVREIDFSRPSKFLPEQERRIERAHEAFCRTASTTRAAELLTEIEFEVLSTDQLTWSIATSKIPQPSMCAVVECQPFGTNILLSMELQLILRLVERLMGGSGSSPVTNRELTDIELALVRRMYGTLLDQLSVIWDELAAVKLGLIELEQVLSSIALVPPSEPSLMLTLEAKVDGSSSTISLVLPYRSVEPMLERMSGSQYGEVAVDPEASSALRASLAEVEVEMRAEVASVHLPIADVLALAPGDVLRFRTPAARGVRLCAGHVPAHRAQPGRNGNHRAVQVVGPIEEDR